MNLIERAGRAVDRRQQRHVWLAVPFAVVKKFGDDGGGLLSTQLAFSAFFSILPLLLLLVTVLGFVMRNDSALRHRILHSAVVDFPIIGTQLTANIGTLPAAGLAAVIGIVTLLFGARGLAMSAQHAMAEIWNIPGRIRPNFWVRQLRALIMFGVFTLGLVVTTALTTLASVLGHHVVLSVLWFVVSALANAGLFVIAFRVLTPKQIGARDQLPGAALAGLAWQVLVSLGSYLVEHDLKHASELYGFFGVTMGLLSWLYLGSEITLYCAEINVVISRRLWPRGMVQPPLTLNDRKALTDLARAQERRPEETIDVTFSSEAGAP